MNRLLLVFTLFCCTSSSYALSNYFSVVNNSAAPITINITPTYGGAHNVSKNISCGKGLDGIVILSNQNCQFQFTDSGTLNPGHSGSIQIAKQDNPAATCTVNYSYHILPTPKDPKKINRITRHSLEFSQPQCSSSNLTKNDLSLISGSIKAAARTMSEKIFGAGPLGGSTDSMAKADCDGVNNCIIVSPTAKQAPIEQGSNLQQALIIQNHIADAQPFNRAQLLGTHNSMISPAYTTGTDLLNLSYTDPDNFISLTNQLEMGVRQVEFDILWYNNQIVLCHNHTSFLPNKASCKGNQPMAAGVQELKNWLTAHPKEFVILYLDINQDLGEHSKNLDNDLSALKNFIYTPAMAQKAFKGLAAQTFPAGQLSKRDLISQGKNMIVVVTGDYQDLKNSKYIFLHTKGSSATMIYHKTIYELDKNMTACDTPQKYANIDKMFNEDPGHHNMRRFNGDRTIINYISDKGKSTDFVTSHNMYKALRCPVNIISVNMLGYTCNKENPRDCAYQQKTNMDRPTDPRFMTYLWSWAYGYPLKGNNPQAYIALDTNNILNSRIKNGNDVTLLNKPHYVLCYKPGPSNQVGSWQAKYAQNGAKTPAQVCGDSMTYAMPPTSYQFNDALNAISADKSIDQNFPVLLNYRFNGHNWEANNGSPLK